MEFYFVLFLWLGLFLLFWGLSKGLAQVEASIEDNLQSANKSIQTKLPLNFDKPEVVVDVIGQYMNMPIYRKVVIESEEYHFDRILTPDNYPSLDFHERKVAPGIVYVKAA